MEPTSSIKSIIEDTAKSYPGYNIYLHYAFLSIFPLYIPIILFSSSLVISAVIFLKKLQHTQNYIILSIALMDVLIALVIIPEHLLFEIPQTREAILSYQFLSYILMNIFGFVNLIYVQFLALLGMDTFVQVKYPIAYWKHNSKKNVILVIVGILIINLSSLFIVTGMQISELSNPEKAEELQASLSGAASVIWGSFVIVSFLLAVCIASLRCNRFCGAAERGTVIFLMAYFVFFCPTFIVDLTDLSKGQYKHMWDIVGRRARYLPSVTNGLIVYLSRPIYRRAFHFFIRRSPLQWKNIERFIYEKRETTVSTLITVPKTSGRIKELTISPSPSGEMSQTNDSRIKKSYTSAVSECVSRDVI